MAFPPLYTIQQTFGKYSNTFKIPLKNFFLYPKYSSFRNKGKFLDIAFKVNNGKNTDRFRSALVTMCDTAFSIAQLLVCIVVVKWVDAPPAASVLDGSPALFSTIVSVVLLGHKSDLFVGKKKWWCCFCCLRVNELVIAKSRKNRSEHLVSSVLFQNVLEETEMTEIGFGH